MTARPRILLDTNVLVSGIVFRGNERRLLDAIIDDRFRLVLCTDIINETSDVLERKFPRIAILFPVFLRLVDHEEISKGEYKTCEKELLSLIKDKTDLPVLAAAEVSEVDYLVTGDKELLSLGRIGDTRITTSRKLLAQRLSGNV